MAWVLCNARWASCTQGAPPKWLRCRSLNLTTKYTETRPVLLVSCRSCSSTNFNSDSDDILPVTSSWHHESRQPSDHDNQYDRGVRLYAAVTCTHNPHELLFTRQLVASATGGGRYCFDHCWFVCLSVNRITQESYGWIFMQYGDWMFANISFAKKLLI